MIVMARYIKSYRISRYWRHIVSYPYHDNYCSNDSDILHYSSKSHCRQQTTLLIAIGVINKERDGPGVISVTFQGGMVHSANQPIGGEREECPY